MGGKNMSVYIIYPQNKQEHSSSLYLHKNDMTERRWSVWSLPAGVWSTDQPATGGAGKSGPPAHLFLGA